MKNSIKLILVLLIICRNFYFAQGSPKGLYKTADDFLNGKLLYSERQSRIRLHDLFKNKIVTVKSKDSIHTISKADLFGYKDKEGNSYRFYKDAIYPILNPTENILLYKSISGTGMKNSPIVETYFFSKDARSPVLPLTLANIQDTFSDVPSFTKLIEICFRYDNDLAEFDTIHNLYRINRLLELAAHEKH